MKRLSRFFILRIDLPAILAIIFFAGLIFLYLIPGFEKAMMDRKRGLIHEMTSSAYSLLAYYHSLEEKGILANEEAKEQAKSAISNIRYGNKLKDYFWITDLHPNMIVHPYRPDLNGTDLTGFQDSKGKTVFVEFVKAVSATGESYVDYMWQWNDDSTRIVPKLSYVRLFEPWSWIIGTGIYIDDVRSEIRRMENKALSISGIIGLVILTLLIAISRQSHRIEDKRSKAEEELLKSKELYRTLAEAGSEGVLIWSRQGLLANKILLSWLGYAEEELKSIAFQDIFSSVEIRDITDSDALYDELIASRYVECVLITKEGKPMKSNADFSRILMGEMRSVLVVVRLFRSFVTQPGFTPHIPLFETIGTGFFRTTYGRKSKFLYATRPTIEILGFDSFQDLHPHAIETFFVDPVQLKSFTSSLASRNNFVRRELLLRRKGGEIIWALVSVMVFESDSRELWCEGTIEPLAASASKNNLPVVDLDDYSASFIMQAPVSAIMRPAVTCPENLSAARAVSIMKENDTQYIIVSNKVGEPMGVIDSGSVGLRLTEGGSRDTEVFKWMISPPDLIRQDTPIQEAFRMIRNSQKKCLLAFDRENKITGIITNAELANAFFKSPELIYSEIREANSSQALRSVYLNSRKIAISMILGHADPNAVSLHLSSIADAITRRVLALCIDESGEPPCRFSFIQTGSAGRMEQTLSTDQDNAIIIENTEGELSDQAGKYFLSLGKKVNDMLATTGFRMCKGGNMAGNPQWCQSLDLWKNYFYKWINMPGPEELLRISIFFDFRHCYGDAGLVDELRAYVNQDLRTSDIFFHHMTAAWKPYSPSVTQLSGGQTDIKKLLMLLTGMIRLYSLKYGIDGYSTLERIFELYSGSHLERRLLHDAIRAWKDLTCLRLIHQVTCISKDKEADNMIDFMMSGSDMQYMAEQAIRTINDLMMKASGDFYTAPI
jgi:signal-transduction protein with cAMP-binding, CBS, and nucleotidyltransferase domain